MHDADDWDRRYRDARHHDAGGPAPELEGIVATFGEVRGRAIDVGCGTGADAVFLAEHGFDVTGVDTSAGALELAARRAATSGVTVDWQQRDALDLPLADGTAVAAFDRGCLHHVPVDDQPRYAAELARVLAPGGRVFLRDRCGGGGHHDSPVTAHGLEQFVRDVPLEVVSVEPFDMVGHGGPVPGMLGVLRRTGDDGEA